ncbi:DUF3231 family protein [Clostridium bowmanii]|uniref:DUF3231 family protein n=1 Tax=Clostridium bowmanii TaxID=132925 RepID=UPI001C0B972D|nr:DUF3231 family protein [Clostridium bowmanii]MBU3191127.1 DUF3231 family protein [Clostridium bowmanii]MCA1075518.1 DUF3231 family protein [Clostridium bowmanii]
MDIISLIKKVKKRDDIIDIQEAYNIYGLLRARYVSTQTVQLFKNFVHDVDWEVVLEKFQKDFENQIDNLQKLGEKFRIIMPNRPPVDVKFATRLNDITDDYIYKKIYHDLVAQLMSLSHAVRTTSTNDNLRNIIIEDLKIHFEDFDILYKFGKLKGWEETYPTYKTAIIQEKEQLSVSEAFHIWDHIVMRYEQLEIIGIFSSFAHDTEFKVILQHGSYVYNKQIKKLEELALKLNVPLPNRAALPVTTPIDPEMITDRFMYRIILSWQLSALDAHLRAIIETIRNESLRRLWTGLLDAELAYYDKYLKYGKMKGWTRVVPIFGEPVT